MYSIYLIKFILCLDRYKDGVPIKEDTRVKGAKINAETFELQFQKTTVDDNGNWAVIARNPHGEMSQFFTFAAQMLPKFEKKLADAEGNEGKQVRFELVATELTCMYL